MKVMMIKFAAAALALTLLPACADTRVGYAVTEAELKAELAGATNATMAAATNYTDAAVANYKPKQTAKASPSAASTEEYQFVDTVSQDANGVITATKKTMRKATTSAPGMVQLNDNIDSTRTDHAATANAVRKVAELAQAALTTESDPIWESEKWDYATTASLGDYIPWSAAASHSGSDRFSLVLERNDGHGNYLAVSESATGGDGPFLFETYLTASSMTDFSYYRPRFYVGGYTGNYFAYYYDVTNAVAALDVALRGVIASASPGDYANVSNLAYSAVQTETDPTVPQWAKAQTKPTYTASEVGAVSTSGGTVTSDNGIRIEGKTAQTGTIQLWPYFSSAQLPAIDLETFDGKRGIYYVDGIEMQRRDGSYHVLEFPYADGTLALTSDIPAVPAWAMAETKPTYTAAEVGATTPEDVTAAMNALAERLTSLEARVSSLEHPVEASSGEE